VSDATSPLPAEALRIVATGAKSDAVDGGDATRRPSEIFEQTPHLDLGAIFGRSRRAARILLLRSSSRLTIRGTVLCSICVDGTRMVSSGSQAWPENA